MYLFHPDKELPGIDTLLDADALAGRIRPWIGEGSISIANIRYKPATSCLVNYRIKRATGVTTLHAKAFTSGDWPVRRKKLVDKEKSGSVWLDDELSFAVFKFPVDTELPSLFDFEKDRESFLAKVLFDEFERREFDNYEVLAYKPNRRFVARLNFASGEPLVLKLHDEESFENVLFNAGALKKLAVSGIPKCAGRSARHKALAYGWLDGQTVDLASQTSSKRQESMQKIFEFLDHLHRPIESRKIKLRVRRSAEGIESITSYLNQICDPVEDLATSISDRLLGTLPTSLNPGLVHGDFYDRQLIENENQVRACDLDECCIADTSSDLANLVAHLRYQSCLDNTHADSAEEVNAQVLEHLGKTADKHARERYQWNCSASLFRLATHPFRSGNAEWNRQTQSVLRSVDEQIARTSCKSQFSKPEVRASGSFRKDCLDSKIKDDPAFSFLHEAFDIAVATQMFKKHLSKLNKRTGSFAIQQIIVRRYKPGRRFLVEYELATDQGLFSILGKASAKRFDQKAYKTQKNLYRKCGFGFRSDDGLYVPKTSGYIEPWQMWFQQKIAGSTAAEFMSDQNLSAVTEQITAALSKLHQSSFCPPREHVIEDELAILSARFRTMMKQQPESAQSISEILENCITIGNSISEHRNVPIHRDFYQDQILFRNDEAFLLDLDLVAAGHPALDVGNFLAHLTEHGIRIHDNPEFWKNEEAEIIQQYLERNPDCNRFDIDAFKAISLARHISISWEIEERRFANQKILLCVQQGLRELTNSQLVTQL